jgi:threonine dehydrogenase-like Zn-dependent dehydrogenase
MRLELAKKLGAHLVVNTAEQDPVLILRKFTDGYGVDAAIIAFGGDATEAFRQLLKMMKVSPDTHQMGRIVIVGGAQVATTYAASTGNIDVRSSARTGPGYHDLAWEHGRDYPPVFVEWTTRRNVSLCLRLISEGKVNVKSLITHRAALSKAPEACEELIQHPERALGVVLLPKQ